jgi:hypothetical protein
MSAQGKLGKVRPCSRALTEVNRFFTTWQGARFVSIKIENAERDWMEWKSERYQASWEAGEAG